MSFDAIINQNKAKEVLFGQLKSGKVAHAYLFLGPEGVGRKKTALEFAKSLNCLSKTAGDYQPCDNCDSCRKIDKFFHPDVQIIDFLWQSRLEDKDLEKQKAIKINTIRALQKEISLKHSEGSWKIYIIEPAEKITLDAANCLLKTLEEPPKNTILILLALHRDNLPATVVSRTQIVRFNPLTEREIRTYLENTLTIEPQKASDAAIACEGSIKDALEYIGNDNTDAAVLWQGLKNPAMPLSKLLEASQKLSKESFEIIEALLLCAKQDFRKKPNTFRVPVETILHYRGLLEENVNPQMVIDAMLIELNNSLRRTTCL